MLFSSFPLFQVVHIQVLASCTKVCKPDWGSWQDLELRSIFQEPRSTFWEPLSGRSGSHFTCPLELPFLGRKDWPSGHTWVAPHPGACPSLLTADGPYSYDHPLQLQLHLQRLLVWQEYLRRLLCVPEKRQRWASFLYSGSAEIHAVWFTEQQCNFYAQCQNFQRLKLMKFHWSEINGPVCKGCKILLRMDKALFHNNVFFSFKN